MTNIGTWWVRSVGKGSERSSRMASICTDENIIN